MILKELQALKDSYIRLSDPTEYYFAIRTIGTWEEWEALCDNPDFKSTIEGWRRELEAKIKSDSLARIIDAAKGETRDALQANKFLLDTPWLQNTATKGRPSRLDILSEAHKLAMNEQKIAQDYERINKGKQ